MFRNLQQAVQQTTVQQAVRQGMIYKHIIHVRFWSDSLCKVNVLGRTELKRFYVIFTFHH